MPDADAATTVGDRVLLRDEPLFGPMVVDHIRTHFAGEQEPNGPAFCSTPFSNGRTARYDQCELIPCPPEYEPAPSDLWSALFWLRRNRALLVQLHGAETVARTERHVRERIRSRERIVAALADEPDGTAVRRAEIAMGAPALGEIFTMDEFVQSERE